MRMTRWQRWLYGVADDLGREVADLLICDPAGWSTSDGFRLTHATARIDIWIVNAAYGMAFRVWPIELGFPSELHPNWATRQLVWSLVKRRKEPSPEAIQNARAVEALRQRKRAA